MEISLGEFSVLSECRGATASVFVVECGRRVFSALRRGEKEAVVKIKRGLWRRRCG